MTNLNIEKKQIDLIRESISVYTTCMHCIDLYRSRLLTFSDIEEFVDDRGKSCLYRLKQMCHELFRNDEGAVYKEKFYDIAVGYIFHEAMKLREIVYQLEYYGPQYDLLTKSEELTVAEKKVIHEFDILISKAQKRLSQGLKEIKTLVRELVEHVRDLIRVYRDNYLLARFILENEKSFIAIYGKKGYHELLKDVYERGRTTLLSKAALSYLQSEYYQAARSLFQKVARSDPADQAAQFLFLYASAFNCYFRNRFSMAGIFADEAFAIRTAGQGLDDYVKSLRGLVAELAREARKTKQGKEGKSRAYL
jgi:hypothetical protein